MKRVELALGLYSTRFSRSKVGIKGNCAAYALGIFGNPMADTSEPTFEEIAQELGVELQAAEAEATTEDAAEETASESKQEETAEETEEAEAEGEDDLSQDEKTEEETELAEATKEKFLKRIDKITAKRREAEEKAESLTEELEELRVKLEKAAQITVAPTKDDPLADVEDESELAARISSARKVKSWALANLEGGSITAADGTEQFIEAAEVRKYLSQAEEMLTEHAPSRKEWIAQRNAVLPEAKEHYPDLFKVGSPMQAAYSETIKRFPELKRLPMLEMLIGDAFEGQKLRFARAEAAAKSKALPAKAANPVKATSTTPTANKGSKVSSDAAKSRVNLNKALASGANITSAQLERALLDII